MGYSRCPAFWFEAFEKSSSPYINQFLSADTIVPGYANPQNLNRYSYVLNNPLRYTDPSGHRPDDGYVGNQLPLNCKNNPQYCNDDGKPKSQEDLAEMRPPKKPSGGDADYCLTHPSACGLPALSQTSTPLPPVSQPSLPWYSGISDFTIGILSNPYTSLTTSSIQVLTGTIMEVGFALMMVPGAQAIGGAVAIGAYAANRAAALVGTGATYYQYANDLNGVNGLDVAVSVTTTLVGTVPQFSEGAALVSFFYDLANAPFWNKPGE